MARRQRFTINQLAEAVKNSRNWKEFLYELHIEHTNYDPHRLKKRLDAAGIDYSHFCHKSYYTQEDFLKACRNAISYIQIAKRLGLKTAKGTKFLRLVKKHKVKIIRNSFINNSLQSAKINS